MSNKQDSKDVKEITLYNFATLRNPEYINKDALSQNVSFICYDKKALNSENETEFKVAIDEFDIETFLDFDELLFQNKNAGNKTELDSKGHIHYDDTYDEDVQIVLNKFFDKILNLYKSKIDDFYEINNLLLGWDADNNIKVELKDEKLFQLKVWLSFVYNLKENNDFKQKEIATNLLRFFHLKKHRNLIDDENKIERNENLSKLINAQIIIPEELFPKSDTFFYGEKSKKITKNICPSLLFKNQHYLKALLLRKEFIDKNFKEAVISEIEKVIKKLKEEENPKQKNDNLISSNSFKYISTLETIKSKNYFLISIDLPENEEKDFIIKEAILRIKNRKFIYSKKEVDENSILLGFNLFFELNTIDFINTKEINFSLQIQFEGKKSETGKGTLIWQESKGKYETCGLLTGENDYFGKAFKPSGYGIQLLGIADYRKVVSTISRYIPAEVAHIENVMASEFREKVTTKETSTEITEFESIESETEKLNETTTNDRFQMQNEVARILNDQKTNNINANVSAFGTGYSASLNTGSSTTNSKEESNKQATTTAKEITNKAVEKIVSKVKRERTVKTTEKFIDVNKYGFDNRGNNEHVSGVYRHINAVYRNKVHNYGKRLTYEFSIPEPALVHKQGIENNKYFKPPPTNPQDFIKDETQLNENNYLIFEKFLDIKLASYPISKKETVTRNNTNTALNSEFNIAIPKGYKPNIFILSYQGIHGVRPQPTQIPGVGSYYDDYFSILINGLIIYLFSYKLNGVFIGKPVSTGVINTNLLADDNIKCRVEGRNIYDFNFNLEIAFEPTQEEIINWQITEYKKITDAYNIRYNEYKDYVKQYFKEKNENSNQIKNVNLLTNREIEINSLKRNCLSYLLDEENRENKIRDFGVNLYKRKSDFTDILINKSHKLDEYTAFVRFLEQAFEWKEMSYSFYPYYWGDKDSWKANYNEDYEDPTFKAFMQAGMARVIVTVRPGWEEAVNLYMTTGKIWQGGNLPIYGSSLFVAIANEIKENTDYIVDDEWETVLPTNLIAIQSSGVAIQQNGLPDLERYGSLGDVKDHSAKLPTSKWKAFINLFKSSSKNEPK